MPERKLILASASPPGSAGSCRRSKHDSDHGVLREHALQIVLGACAGLSYAHDKVDLDEDGDRQADATDGDLVAIDCGFNASNCGYGGAQRILGGVAQALPALSRAAPPST